MPENGYAKLENVSLLFLRLIVAGVFLYAGIAKWAFWSAPPAGTPEGMTYLIRFLAIVEPLGALALIVGFLTRWAAAGLSLIMVGAIFVLLFTMNAPLFTSPAGTGLDYNFLILAANLALVAFGAGKWAVDGVGEKE